MNASRHPIWLALLLCHLGCAALAACGDAVRTHGGRANLPRPADFERGPHNGRLLRDGDFSLEVTIFEDGVPPEFHVYPYRNNQPLDPRQVQLGMSVSRLGGEVNHFAFTPQQDYLRASAVVEEPHSFDVAVTATQGGAQHNWTYASYEGRTTIAQAAADAAGVKTERAGQAVLEELITAAGRVELQPQGRRRSPRLVSGPRHGDDQDHRSAGAEGRGRRARRIELEPSDLCDPGADGGRDHGAATPAWATSPATRRCT